jgi:hypothetical protein
MREYKVCVEAIDFITVEAESEGEAIEMAYSAFDGLSANFSAHVMNVVDLEEDD